MSIKEASPLAPRLPLDHAELLRLLYALESAYPSLEITYLGASVLDRGIPIVRLGHGRRTVLYLAALRGTEHRTAALLCRFLCELAALSQRNARIGHLHYQSILETHTFLILPMLNPDGAEYCIHGVSEDNPLRDRLISENGGSQDFSAWAGNARGIPLTHGYPEEDAAPSKEPALEISILCNFLRYQERLLGVMLLEEGERGIRCAAAPRIDRISARLARMTSYPTVKEDTELGRWCLCRLGAPVFSVGCKFSASGSPLPHLYSELREALFTFPILL